MNSLNIAELEGIHGITMDDLRTHPDTDSLMQIAPPMVVLRVKEDFNLNIENQVFNFYEDDVYVMQFNLYYSILGILKRDKKENALEPYKKVRFKEIHRPYRGEDLTGKSLFIMATSIGDTLFMQPIVKYLKNKYPSCTIKYAAGDLPREMIACYPKGLVDGFVGGTLFLKLDELKNFDYQIYPNFFITKNFEAHTLNAYDVFKKAVNVDFDYEEFPPELVPKRFILNEMRGKLPDKFVVIQMRASTGNRMMRSEKWRNIIPGIIERGFDVVFVDNPGMFDMYENEILNFFPDLKDHLWNLCKFSKSLKHSIAVIASADLVIGIDSSLLHIGAALKKPLIGIYGPFSAQVRLSHYKNTISVEPKSVDCVKYPCFLHQDEMMMGHCEYGLFHAYPDCMEKIDENDVLKALDILKSSQDLTAMKNLAMEEFYKEKEV